MIEQRYQVSAMPVDGSNRISGWLWKNKGYYISNEIRDLVEINVDTIEPVSVKPLNQKLTLSGRYGACPNCNEVGIILPQAHCDACGMALDWNEEKDSPQLSE